MMVLLNNPIQSTWIFISILVVALLCSGRKKKDEGLSPSRSQELKGFAILAIALSHIGYFLVTDHQFLFPLTILAGVGVDLFLFLSGYGLTTSKLKKEEGIGQFYKRRVLKLLTPFWITVLSFLILDFFVLHISYSKVFITQAFLGIFPHADLYHDLNSPLWYFTLILAYYILYPLFFSKKRPWVTALVLFAVTYFFTLLKVPQFSGVLGLHTVHLYAFPLGVLVAGYSGLALRVYANTMKPRGLPTGQASEPRVPSRIFRPLATLILLLCVGYISLHSGVGKGVTIEQAMSLVTVALLISLFLVKKYEYRLLSLFGLYSYEIYLLHWPILYRYDLLYKTIPAWLATALYLILFIGLGWILKKVSEKIFHILKI